MSGLRAVIILCKRGGQSVSIPVHGNKSLHKGLESKLLKFLDN